MDETGFFYRQLPDKTLAVKRKACKKVKLAKYFVTLVLACLMTGEKLVPLLIRKSKNPGCFRGIDVNSLNCV